VPPVQAARVAEAARVAGAARVAARVPVADSVPPGRLPAEDMWGLVVRTRAGKLKAVLAAVDRALHQAAWPEGHRSAVAPAEGEHSFEPGQQCWS
jgi:hypothetical protein